ncbi:MAG: hypothetical protein MJ180_02500 [Candidatus Gastranaerophilales bacterium]|nr:hypothetical protein [Candidatus Gastranaerophilales bacterium]
MINAINPANIITFSQNNAQITKNNDKNPVSKVGEASLITKATFIGGLAVGARLLWAVFDNSFLIEEAAEKAGKIVNKNHNQLKGWKKNLLHVGAFTGIVAAAVCGFALLYTLFNAPKIAYKAKLNSYKKGKDMDAYISANKAEKELYTQLDKKAKSSNSEEKKNLREQYMQLKVAKNDVPTWIKLKK